MWDFDDATFDRPAASFDNPDHVSIVIHNYRWRLGLAEGEAKYDAVERQLAEFPVITVPTITLEGDANGAPHADSSSYARKFSGRYAHRVITGGIGHKLPQEAPPKAFAEAVIDVGKDRPARLFGFYISSELSEGATFFIDLEPVAPKMLDVIAMSAAMLSLNAAV